MWDTASARQNFSVKRAIALYKPVCSAVMARNVVVTVIATDLPESAFVATATKAYVVTYQLNCRAPRARMASSVLALEHATNIQVCATARSIQTGPNFTTSTLSFTEVKRAKLQCRAAPRANAKSGALHAICSAVATACADNNLGALRCAHATPVSRVSHAILNAVALNRVKMAGYATNLLANACAHMAFRVTSVRRRALNPALVLSVAVVACVMMMASANAPVASLALTAPWSRVQRLLMRIVVDTVHAPATS